MTDLTARASKAERHLAATQAQLADAETKLGEAREKVAVAEGKWEARVKEYERLVKSLKEENKRLKQGAKERVSELEDFIQYVPYSLPCLLALLTATALSQVAPTREEASRSSQGAPRRRAGRECCRQAGSLICMCLVPSQPSSFSPFLRFCLTRLPAVMLRNLLCAMYCVCDPVRAWHVMLKFVALH